MRAQLALCSTCACLAALLATLQVLDILANKGLHRVYVVDDNGAAVSIVTLTGGLFNLCMLP